MQYADSYLDVRKMLEDLAGPDVNSVLAETPNTNIKPSAQTNGQWQVILTDGRLIVAYVGNHRKAPGFTVDKYKSNK